MEAIARGDRAAFAELYDSLSPAVYGLVAHLTQDAARAQQVLHDVFLDAWRHAPRLADTGASPGEWLKNLALARCSSPLA